MDFVCLGEPQTHQKQKNVLEAKFRPLRAARTRWGGRAAGQVRAPYWGWGIAARK